MTLFDHVLLQARAGLADLHEERDRARTFEARYGGSPALDVYLAQLEEERAQHATMVEGIALLCRQRHPILSLEVRPTRRMLKASLRLIRPAMRPTGTER